MHLILQYKEPRDWVIATGESRTIRNLCEITFKMLGLNYNDFVKINKKNILDLKS